MEPKLDVPHPESNKLFLHDKTLQMYGCKNCIWKSYGQCPKGFTEPDRTLPEGYCMELANFILGLGEPGDTVSAIKEKYFIYTQEMQAQADNSDFHHRYKEIKTFKATEHPQFTPKELAKKLFHMEQEMLSSKIWWSKLTDSVVKNLARIVDRESRSKDVKANKQLNVQELNIILQDSAKVLLEDKEEK